MGLIIGSECIFQTIDDFSLYWIANQNNGESMVVRQFPKDIESYSVNKLKSIVLKEL